MYGTDANSLHLHVVLFEATEIAAAVIVVSFNTVKEWTDKTLVLQAADHPFIVRETAVSYNQVRAIPAAFLEDREAANQNLHPNFATFRRHLPVSADLLQRLRAGALASPLTPKGMKSEIKLRLGVA